MARSAILTAVAAILFAGQAFALSCIAPDVAAAFDQASKSEKSYVVLLGKFDFTPPERIEGQAINIRARFDGKLLTGKGFTDDVSVPTNIELGCAGPWCAEIVPQTDYIAFVEQSETTLNFAVGPCYGLAFQDPTDEDIARLEQCAAGGSCDPQN